VCVRVREGGREIRDVGGSGTLPRSVFFFSPLLFPFSSPLTLVVVMRPCRSTSVTSVRMRAFRWLAGRFSLGIFLPCRMATHLAPFVAVAVGRQSGGEVGKTRVGGGGGRGGTGRA
jgi:hypothetical protein